MSGEKDKIDFNQRLEAPNLTRLLDGLKGKTSYDGLTISICETIEYSADNHDVLLVEYNKLKTVKTDFDENKKRLVIIPYIYGGGTTAIGSRQNTAAHTDMIIVRTEKNGFDAEVTYIATTNWLAQKEITKYKVKDTDGRERTIDEGILNTIHDAKSDNCNIVMPDGTQVTFSKENLNSEAIKETEKAKFTGEEVQKDVKEKIKIFCTVDADFTKLKINEGESTTPLFKVTSKDIKVIHPCISWDHYTCGHAAIEGMLRHVFVGDNSLNSQDEPSGDKVIERLKKLEDGKADEVIKEIKENHNATQSTIPQTKTPVTSQASSQDKLDGGPDLTNLQGQNGDSAPNQNIVDNKTYEDKPNFFQNNKKSIAITPTIALSIIIPSLILVLAPRNIKNIGISVGLCLTGLLTALLITTCYQPNNKLHKPGVQGRPKSEGEKNSIV